MGRNNRQRRAEKKRRGRGGPTHSRPGPDEWAFEGDDTFFAEALIFSAARATVTGDGSHVEMAVETLLSLPPYTATGGTVAGWTLSGCLEKALRAAWGGGWQPRDVVRAASKRLTGRHADLVVTAIASEARTSAGSGTAVPQAWLTQLGDMGAVVWWGGREANFLDRWAARERLDPFAAIRLGVELLGLLVNLPVLPRLMPPPAQWGHSTGARIAPAGVAGVDDRVLAKVRALLAKAESTTFDEEAEALTAKAQELMARHAIDQAMLQRADPSAMPTGSRVAIDDPYAGAKANLLSVVAGANRCRTVWFDSYGFCTIFGFPIDVEIVDVLYTSLLVQATRAMTAAGSVRSSDGRSRTRSFRQSFLVAFANRIGERLRDATDSAATQAHEVHGGHLLPVLAGRRAAVDDAVAQAFPRLVSQHLSVTNYEGWVAGQVAADMALLGPEQQVLPGVSVSH